jgi:hypothetical protein
MSTATEPRTVYKFRVLRGRHAEGGKTYGKGLPDGDVVTTTKNLSNIFDRHAMRSKKFLLLSSGPGEPGLENSAPVPAVPTGTQEMDDNLLETFQSMTVAELRAHAAAEEIELGDASKKDDIVLRILEATQSK